MTFVFVQKRKDVLLDVKEDDIPKYVFIFKWTFKVDNSLITFSLGREPTVTDDYFGRVEFSVRNHSVKLKNLQEADSGVYTAQVIGPQDKVILTEYNITVQGKYCNLLHIDGE